MESKLFLNAELPLHFHQNPTSSIPNWQQQESFSSSMPIQANELKYHGFFNPNWEKSTDQSPEFDSPMSSNSNMPTESFMIREVIGKLGNIGNSAEISPHFQPIYSSNTSCYTTITTLSSPPKPDMSSVALNSTVAEFPVDPGFAERAARYSCFGSRSFNGRTCPIGLNQNEELQYRCGKNDEIPVTGNDNKLFRVSSSPSPKAIGSNNQQKSLQDRSELGSSNSQGESSVSEQNPVGECGIKASSELNSKKRKTVSKAKSKETQLANRAKSIEVNDNSNSKRSKGNEGNSNDVKEDEEKKENGEEKQNNANTKPLEPPKDYIHVRARRGQATDSHSLAERVRREKISERMKLLQDLVPGCNKVTGKALMLDEIINYVQLLQRQVECLSMKLASVNTRLDISMDTLVSKDIFQTGNQLPHPIFPIDSSASDIFGHQPRQNPAFHSNISNGAVTHCSVDPLPISQNLNMHFPPLEGFHHTPPQFPTLSEDDLRSIVQMGFDQFQVDETFLTAQRLHGSNQVTHMKTEI